MNPLPAIPGRLRMALEPLGAEPATPVAPVRGVATDPGEPLPRALPAVSAIAAALPGAQVRIVRVLERLSDDAYRVAVEGRTFAVRVAGQHEP